MDNSFRWTWGFNPYIGVVGSGSYLKTNTDDYFLTVASEKIEVQE